jgi:hypothetical protein
MITIYHLDVTLERIVWLMEEPGLPYALEPTCASRTAPPWMR